MWYQRNIWQSKLELWEVVRFVIRLATRLLLRCTSNVSCLKDSLAREEKKAEEKKMSPGKYWQKMPAWKLWTWELSLWTSTILEKDSWSLGNTVGITRRKWRHPEILSVSQTQGTEMTPYHSRSRKQSKKNRNFSERTENPIISWKMGTEASIACTKQWYSMQFFVSNIK